jgi:hypothetical protein
MNPFAQDEGKELVDKTKLNVTYLETIRQLLLTLQILPGLIISRAQ